jgi:Na+-transporting NADH:ubiquinone oxidoreductase subunit F
VKEDIRITIPEELFNVRQYDYQVEKLDLVTPKIKHLRLTLPEDKEISFKPGQYIQILAPIYPGNDEEVYRAYSIASAPSDNKAIELFIGYVPEGICTTYIHQHLKLNDSLTIVGPFGDFHYHQNDREMYMVAVGTGMAPIMSILKHMRDEKIDRKVTFFFGARSGEDLYMMDVLEDIQKTLPNFTLKCCLSRPKEEDNWSGEKGRVTDLIDKYVDNASDGEAYLCGSPKVIDSVVEKLQAKGMPEAHIYYDKFE